MVGLHSVATVKDVGENKHDSEDMCGVKGKAQSQFRNVLTGSITSL